MASINSVRAFNDAAEFHQNCKDSEMARKPGDPDFAINYHGAFVPFPFILSLDLLGSFEARKDDICVTSFPKTGQTIMAAMVVMIENEAHPDSLLKGAPLKLKVPYLEMAFPRAGSWEHPVFPIEHVKDLAGPRIYGTHHNANSLPAQVVNTAKIVYVYRNPKDTIVSLYHMMVSGSKAFGFKGTLSDAVELFLNDQCLFSPYFEHLESFWRIRNQANIHLTCFENILKNPKKEIESLAGFLGRELTDRQVADVMHHCSFDQMKHNKNTNFSEFETIGFIDMKKSPFMRAGKVGNWKKHLTVELSEKIDHWTERNFAERPGLTGLVFQYE